MSTYTSEQSDAHGTANPKKQKDQIQGDKTCTQQLARSHVVPQEKSDGPNRPLPLPLLQAPSSSSSPSPILSISRAILLPLLSSTLLSFSIFPHISLLDCSTKTVPLLLQRPPSPLLSISSNLQQSRCCAALKAPLGGLLSTLSPCSPSSATMVSKDVTVLKMPSFDGFVRIQEFPMSNVNLSVKAVMGCCRFWLIDRLEK
ncbi:hypothetical protein Droror1_Dr00012593 [Drosera rotundifolia]